MIPALSAALTGFGTGFSLILAIGAQNAFVLRQGLRGEHVFWVALVCAVSDAILITAGVLGFGALVEVWPAFPVIMRYGGAAFLIAYGALRMRSAMRGGDALEIRGTAQPIWPAITTCLVLTWANPHVYLDTLALIGAISTNYPWGMEKTGFGIGATSASFVFFFGLAYGARLLAPIMQNARAWVVLDVCIALLMWSIAAGLVLTH